MVNNIYEKELRGVVLLKNGSDSILLYSMCIVLVIAVFSLIASVTTFGIIYAFRFEDSDTIISVIENTQTLAGVSLVTIIGGIVGLTVYDVKLAKKKAIAKLDDGIIDKEEQSKILDYNNDGN